MRERHGTLYRGEGVPGGWKWALDTFKYYLLGREFTLETDHRPLQWMDRMWDTNARITRWYLLYSLISLLSSMFLGKLTPLPTSSPAYQREILGWGCVMAMYWATHNFYRQCLHWSIKASTMLYWFSMLSLFVIFTESVHGLSYLA